MEEAVFVFRSLAEFAPHREAVLAFLSRAIPDGSMALFIALNEGVNNALIHGNRLDDSKRVTLVLRRSARDLEMRIADEGAGFEPRKMMEMCREPCDEHGRGLVLMAACVDRMSFVPERNEIVLVKRLIFARVDAEFDSPESAGE